MDAEYILDEIRRGVWHFLKKAYDFNDKVIDSIATGLITSIITTMKKLEEIAK